MKIGFIGCGNMASAMISGMLKKGLYKKDEIIVSNLTEEGSKRSREKLGVVTTLDNHEVVKNTKLVFRHCAGENSCLVRRKMWTASESGKNDAEYSCSGWGGYDWCMCQ